jgi:hypothetical protein
MITLAEWRELYPEAAATLAAIVNSADMVPSAKHPDGSEAAIQQQARLDAARAGDRLWRNNVGALEDKRGALVRFGLMNDSKATNASLKSGDLIGIKRVTITLGMVGTVIGQFYMRECKEAGWSYCGDDRELAQLNAINLVNQLGGDAAFLAGGL